MKGIILKACLMGAALVMVSACSSSTPQASTTTSSASQLFTLEPTPDRKALQRTAQGYLATLLAEPANEQITLVNANPKLISKDTQELAISLPDGKSAQFHLRDFNTITSGIDGWVGYKPSAWKQKHPSSSSEIDNDPLYYLSIVREGGKLIGTLRVDGQPYRLDYVGHGQHALIKVDESKLPPEGEPLVSPEAVDRDDTVGKVPQSAHSTIRVLFVTTNQLRDKRPNNRAELASALNDANQYMINSRIPVTYELAGFYDADYDETGRSYNEQLNDIRLARPFGENVLRERENLGADMVSMYSTATQYCGMAWVNSNKLLAHSVISCVGSLAHELGHNFGGGDGWNPNPSEGSYKNGYKHESEPKFHTRMVTSHGALGYFSNPEILYQGVPMGSDRHNMARLMNERRETIANFYPPMPQALNNQGRFEQGSPNTCLEAFISARVQFTGCSSNQGQHWKIEPLAGANTSRIVTQDGISCLIARADNTVSLEKCPPSVIDGLLWEVTVQPGDTLKIKRYNHNLCLASTLALRSTPEILPCDNKTHQRWMRHATAE